MGPAAQATHFHLWIEDLEGMEPAVRSTAVRASYSRCHVGKPKIENGTTLKLLPQCHIKEEKPRWWAAGRFYLLHEQFILAGSQVKDPNKTSRAS